MVRTDNMSPCLTKRGGSPFLFFPLGVEEECLFGGDMILGEFVVSVALSKKYTNIDDLSHGLLSFLWGLSLRHKGNDVFSKIAKESSSLVTSPFLGTTVPFQRVSPMLG